MFIPLTLSMGVENSVLTNVIPNMPKTIQEKNATTGKVGKVNLPANIVEKNFLLMIGYRLTIRIHIVSVLKIVLTYSIP